MFPLPSGTNWWSCRNIAEMGTSRSGREAQQGRSKDDGFWIHWNLLQQKA
jgi:hypothetical protein